MPIDTWSYIGEAEHVRHMGPVSQDFWAAFRLGMDDKTITNIDEAGVALAAIQGLNQVMQEKDAQIRAQQREIRSLRDRVARIEAILERLDAARLAPVAATVRLREKP